MWLRNRNIVNLSLRIVETFLLFLFPPLENSLSSRVKFRSFEIRGFRGSRQLAVFGKMNIVGSYGTYFFL